jgi:hypothetical protein
MWALSKDEGVNVSCFNAGYMEDYLTTLLHVDAAYCANSSAGGMKHPAGVMDFAIFPREDATGRGCYCPRHVVQPRVRFFSVLNEKLLNTRNSLSLGGTK